MRASPDADRRTIAGRSIRWNDEFATRAYADGLWVTDTLADALANAAELTPGRIAVVDGEVRMSCRDLHRQATALAGALVTRLPVGSVVASALPNWHEAAVVYLGATLAGMVVTPILPSLRDREIEFIVDDADVRIVFVPSSFRSHDYPAMLTRVMAGRDRPPEVVVVRGDPGAHTDYARLLADPARAPLPMLDPDAVRMILYTSGTTGRPKGVMHTHNSLHALLAQIRVHWRVEPGDAFLVPSPVAHIGGSIYAFEAPLLMGTTAVLMERWDAADGVDLIAVERCTHMAGATPFLEQLLTAAQSAGTRLPELKVFICGGASVPPSLIRRATAFFDRAMVTRVYGSTEVPVTTVGTPDDADRAADTDGRPGIADVRLADHDAATAGSGEILARGAQMLVGYLHEEDETNSFDDDGYFRTGDLGTWDRDCLVVTGRAKDIIIRNGENISPKEIEDILVGHDGIAEVAIVGVPHPTTGERAWAVIVPSTPTTTVAVADLWDYLRERGVSAFKVPEQVAMWTELPKNAAGKVLKQEIRWTLRHEGG
ncbi:AMP-binding protein [Mycobacterium yunnanensis]|uniref:AMP-binding protein n=1 Tax=Mycobacterium yunnanensis TaxID=368477 RepID=A0A9X3BVC2_9MYCO|nr:AMP-binding protein [Mycobacterium yunnanensis]MCV7423215.1 AMP-binding protein [Mycobacterium yunnanensis]